MIFKRLTRFPFKFLSCSSCFISSKAVTIFSVLVVVFSLLLIVACSKNRPDKPVAKESKSNENKIELIIKNKKIEVEIAKTPEARALGLMFRKYLDWNSGMLFVFEQEGIYPFWMKNTKIPLSIAYISKDNVIVDIQEMMPNQEEIRYASTVPFLYALEMNQAWFLENSIKIGDTVYGIP